MKLWLQFLIAVLGQIIGGGIVLALIYFGPLAWLIQ